MRYKITADSTCDLGRDLIERYDIGILPLYVQLGEKTYRDGIDIQPDDIYAHVAAGGGLATTAAVNLADYVRAFTELSDRYDFVIHVNISSDFSCSHQNAKLAAADLPNVYVVDSRNLSTGHGHIVLEAARMAAEGMGPEEIVQQLEALTARVDASFILEQLEYMKKGGRCSAVALLGANLLTLIDAVQAGIDASMLPVYLAGVAAAFISGFLAISLLRILVQRKPQRLTDAEYTEITGEQYA